MQKISTLQKKLTQRIFGLDLFRSIAIILVVFGHSQDIILSYFKNFHIIPLPDGVDLFFVLSGFLIGSILINLFENQKNITYATLFHFFKRRWYRTLPNYFLFLLLNIVLIYFGIINGSLNKYLIPFFAFLQNFTKPYDFLFWESWSLSVEEWFYVLFPLLLFLLYKVTRKKYSVKKIILIGIISFLILPLIYRISQSGRNLHFDLFFRKLVLTRLDTIGYGLLAAYIRFYYARFWEKSKNITLTIGIILLVLLIYTDKNVFFLETFYYSGIGLSLILLLPIFESWKIEKIPWKPFQFISRISYSMYLTNLIILQLIVNFFNGLDFKFFILEYTLFWFFVILSSYLIYKFYEKPFMDLRNKL